MARNAAEERELAWNAAVEAWADGNLASAFHFCQAALARGQDNADMHALLASIAIGLGQYDRAQIHLRDAARRTPRQAEGGKTRYIVIQPWGCGFWGEVDHVLSQLAIAEITGRMPIVHWGVGGAYGVPGYDNAWNAYFQPLSNARLGELQGADLSIAPSYWTRENLHRTSVEIGRPLEQRISSLYFLAAGEDVVVADCYTRLMDVIPWAPSGHWLAQCSAEEAYRGLCESYLRLVPALGREVDRLADAMFCERPVLAVHFRTQTASKNNEAAEDRPLAIEDYFPAIDALLHTLGGGRIFLLTDFNPCVRRMQDRYGPRLLSLPATRLDSAGEVEVRLKLGVDLHAAAREVIIDAYLAARCDAFLGDGASGVSCAIGHLKRWESGRFALMRANVALHPGRIQL
ncbi:MAG: hypothetical protein HYR63_24545 [Proteobacteria bacterium]|nr:hypothetical protein [Pseudomonadota bacterium]